MDTPNKDNLLKRVIEIEKLDSSHYAGCHHSIINSLCFELLGKYKIVLLEDSEEEVWWAYIGATPVEVDGSNLFNEEGEFNYSACASSSCPEEAIYLVIINQDNKIKREKMAKIRKQAEISHGLLDAEGDTPYAYHQGAYQGQNIYEEELTNQQEN